MSCETNIVRGAVAGMIGGLVASWVMNQLQAAGQRTSQKVAARSGSDGAQRSAQQREDQQQQEGGADATVKTAQAISRGLFSHDLSDKEKEVAGPAIHYGYGALVGGLYGAVAEVWRGIGLGYGSLYGVALFVLGDETAVPAMGLGPSPRDVPAKGHADYLAAHLLYGGVLDAVRRIARRIL
jgi:hypothetical protein